MTTLEQLPALVVLERIPVPLLAIGHDGGILFANTAFAEMVGCEPDEVLSLRFHQIFHQAPASESELSVLHGFANTVVELAHKDGSVVRALMSRSAVMRADDQCALAVFQDLTEQLWEEGREPMRGIETIDGGPLAPSVQQHSRLKLAADDASYQAAQSRS